VVRRVGRCCRPREEDRARLPASGWRARGFRRSPSGRCQQRGARWSAPA